jgi:hypothetical protein
MEKPRVNKSAMTLLMVALLVMTFFIPILSPIKNVTISKSDCTTIIKGSDSPTSDPTENQTSVNLIEEEEEYTPEKERVFEIQSPILITVSFSSPNLFFTEHCGEVSGPPPWL